MLSDGPIIQITSESMPARPVSVWRFRLIQITVLLIACFYADAVMTGGIVRRELAQDAGNVWQAALDHIRDVHLF